jgi:biotin operon repressor
MTDDMIKNMDPTILLSIMNTKLRDEYASLDMLCDDLEITKEDILNKLKTIGYDYNETKNQFK